MLIFLCFEDYSRQFWIRKLPWALMDGNGSGKRRQRGAWASCPPPPFSPPFAIGIEPMQRISAMFVVNTLQTTKKTRSRSFIQRKVLLFENVTDFIKEYKYFFSMKYKKIEKYLKKKHNFFFVKSFTST